MSKSKPIIDTSWEAKFTEVCPRDHSGLPSGWLYQSGVVRCLNTGTIKIYWSQSVEMIYVSPLRDGLTFMRLSEIPREALPNVNKELEEIYTILSELKNEELERQRKEKLEYDAAIIKAWNGE
jgi:hypothetical protein